MNKPFCWFVKLTGVLPYLLLNRPKYYYEDKNVQSRRVKGPAIVMPNHHTIWDFATMMYAFPARNLRCLIAELIYEKGRFMSAVMKGLGAIRVNRDAHDFAFIEKSCEVLKKGGVIEVYPEARLAGPDEETPLPFKTSVTYLALASGVPLIPVVTNGGIWKKKRMRVLIGTPINVRALYDETLSERDNIEAITNLLRKKIIELNYELEARTKEKKKQ